MTRAAIYPRYSSDNQRGESISAQVRACREYAQAKGYRVIGVYPDEARSAMSDDRPAFQRAIRDAKAGRFDVLLVHKLDRFARDRYDAAHYRRELKRAKVRLESVTEPLDDSPESGILISVLEGMAEYYSRNLARETRKGLRENALQARCCGGKPPLGYDLDPAGHYIINEPEAAVVRLIFEMYDAGRTYSDILAALVPYRTRRGRPFGKNSLHDILRNEKYCGRFVYNKRDYSGERANSHTFRPVEEWVTVEGGVPALVDEELWERVQAKMDGRKVPGERARQKAREVYLLSGLIYCGVCGQAYVGNSSVRSSGYRWAHYQCGSRRTKEHCENIRVSKAEAERVVLDGLREINVSWRDRIITDILDGVEKRKGEMGQELTRARARVVRIESAIRAIVERVKEGLGNRPLLEELDALDKELDPAKAALAEVECREGECWTRAQIEEYLNHIDRAMAEGTDPRRLKQTVGDLVERVTVYPDRLEVTYRVDGLGGSGGTTDADGSPKGLPSVSVTLALKRKTAPKGG